MENTFLTDVLEGINVVHSYLSRDLANERLSKSNQQKRYHHIQLLDSLRTKINSTHPSVQPSVNIPKISHPPPAFKPPPPIPDEPQELYEVPEIKDEAEDYLTFEPSQTDEPQEDYLEMEVEEGRIQEEMYEDPTQTIQDDEQQELYEEPNIENSNPSIQVSYPPPIQSVPPHVNSNNQNEAGAGYMDPIKLKESDKRNSLLPEDIKIEDWEDAYEQSFVNRRKEKIKASKLKNVVMKGYLEKLGGKSQKNWQRRYCVLAEMFMYFYEKESSATYNNRIPIPGFVPNPSAELTKPKKNQFAFKLSFTTSVGVVDKDYFFRARTEKERDKWVQSIREIFELGRGMIEKRKSMTLPHTSVSQIPQSIPRPLSGDFEEQENYETLVPALESDEEQEEYVDVNTHHIDDDEPQEEYVDLQPTNKEIIEEEPQEDYVEPSEFQMPQRPPLASSQPPLPPPPLQVSRPPQQLQQPVRRPDPHVDTEKTYLKRQNGVQYDRVYVLMWDFNGTDSDELKLNRGDLVLVNEPKVGQEWWYGEQLDQDANRKNGSCGLFPASYSSPAFQLIC